MFIEKIEFQNKVAIDEIGVPEINKVTAGNINEIKSVVNHNADFLKETDDKVEEYVSDTDSRMGGIEADITNISADLEKAQNDIDNLNDNTYSKTETEDLISNAVSEEATVRENADIDLQNQIDAITVSSDVVDIVGTYADLENYDTSKLTNDDVVKVLQDSTHNNAVSYYRWVISQNVGSWVYIGSEGPFYTKGEADNKFVEKEQGKGLSQNDFTNTLKSKLDGIANGAQVNVIETVKVNGVTINPDNKTVDIEVPTKTSALQNDSGFIDNTVNDLENYYKKDDTYSKDEVDTLLEEKINTTDIETDLTDESTNSKVAGAKAVYDALVERDLKIAELEEENEALYNDHPDIKGKSTELSLQGTGDLPMKTVPYGNITQETREGYNKLNVTMETQTKNGVTATVNADKSVTLSNTSTSQAVFYLRTSITLPAGTYYASGVIGGSENTYFFGILDGSDWIFRNYNGVTSFTLTEEKTFTQVWIAVANGVTPNTTIKPMISTVNTSNYEQYGASPSTAYPSPVKVVDGSYVEKVENGNLLNTDITQYTFQANQAETKRIGLVQLEAGQTYHISYNVDNESSSNVRNTPQLRKENDLSINSKYQSATTNYNLTAGRKDWEVTITESAKYELLYWCQDPNVNISVSNFMVSVSNNTDYLPHAEQTVSIDTSPNPLYSENDYYYLNNGEWYVHNEYAREDLTSSLVLERSLTSNSNYRFQISATGINYKASTSIANIFCNIASKNSANANYSETESVASNSADRLYLYLNETKNMTVDQFKAWLDTKDIYVIYELATPTNTKITNTNLIVSLEAMQNLQSYYDITHISQTHADSQADMNIQAYAKKSLKVMQSEIDELKQAIVNS